MKFFVISTCVVLVLLFTLSNSFGAAAAKKVSPPASAKADVNVPADVNAPADVNVPADVNSVADANATAKEPNAVVDEDTEELKKKLDRLIKPTDKRKEEMEWTRQRIESRIGLLESAQKQAVAELNFIRELAVAEEAAKTVKAIDLLIEKRAARFQELSQVIKEREDKEAEREKAREEREKVRGEREKGRRSRDSSRKER